jgi:hypothetical protein
MRWLLIFVSISVSAQDIVTRNAINSFKDLRELLSIPNDAHNPADIEKNMQWCENAFARRGFTTTRLKTNNTVASRRTKSKEPICRRARFTEDCSHLLTDRWPAS